MNLLPPEYKKNLVYEAWRRYVLILGPYLFIATLIAFVLLLPSFFFLTYQIDGIRRNADAIRASAEYRDYLKGKDRIASINTTLSSFVSYENQSQKTTPWLYELYSKVPSGVTLMSLTTAKDKNVLSVIITGNAVDRETFRSFKNALEQSESISKVDSPVTNLISSENVNFTVTVYLK